MCKYCEENVEIDEVYDDGYGPSGLKVGKTFRFETCNGDKTANASIVAEGTTYYLFNYCPMCGRQLNCVEPESYNEVVQREG